MFNHFTYHVRLYFQMCSYRSKLNALGANIIRGLIGGVSPSLSDYTIPQIPHDTVQSLRALFPKGSSVDRKLHTFTGYFVQTALTSLQVNQEQFNAVLIDLAKLRQEAADLEDLLRRDDLNVAKGIDEPSTSSTTVSVVDLPHEVHSPKKNNLSDPTITRQEIDELSAQLKILDSQLANQRIKTAICALFAICAGLIEVPINVFNLLPFVQTGSQEQTLGVWLSGFVISVGLTFAVHGGLLPILNRRKHYTIEPGQWFWLIFTVLFCTGIALLRFSALPQYPEGTSISTYAGEWGTLILSVASAPASALLTATFLSKMSANTAKSSSIGLLRIKGLLRLNQLNAQWRAHSRQINLKSQDDRQIRLEEIKRRSVRNKTRRRLVREYARSIRLRERESRALLNRVLREVIGDVYLNRVTRSIAWSIAEHALSVETCTSNEFASGILNHDFQGQIAVDSPPSLSGHHR